MPDLIASVEGLNISLRSAKTRPLIEDVSLRLKRGRITGLVGESGSGKSLTSLSLLGLNDPRAFDMRATSAVVDGIDISGFTPRLFNKIRGRKVSMVFQDPGSSLDPCFTIGAHLEEVLRAHTTLDGPARVERALELLEWVGMDDPARVRGLYTFEMSGGMQQRTLIALAMASEPSVIVADEPTTALDVVVQRQVLDLLRRTADSGVAVLLVTHDLSVMAEYADELSVMYAGHVVESGPTRDLIDNPIHPYTHALISSVPSPTTRVDRLPTIPGQVPKPSEMPRGCRFAASCAFAQDICLQDVPTIRVDEYREHRCVRADELAERSA